jgi:hypothetical protein
VGYWRILACEGKVFLDELDADASLRLLLDEAAKVIDVAGQPVHAMHHDGVALAGVGEQGLQLRPFGVFSGRLVGEQLVDLKMLKLAVGVLVDTADPNLPDALTLP